MYFRGELIYNLIFNFFTDTCKSPHITLMCFYDYSPLTEDRGSYDPAWASYTNTPPANTKVYGAFQYTPATLVYPTLGKYSDYGSGGFVYTLDITQDIFQIQSDFYSMLTSKWINQNTRAVIIEFTVYNPNINLFGFMTVLFEFMPTGNIVKSHRFDTLSLYDDKTMFIVLTVLQGCYLAVMALLFFRRMWDMKKHGIMHTLKEFLFYLDMIMVVISLVTIAIYVYEMYARNKNLKMLAVASAPISGKPLEMQSLIGWVTWLNCLMAVCSFFALIRFLKFLRFSRSILVLTNTLRGAMVELGEFGIVFFVAWFAFVNIMYLTMSDKMSAYSSLMKSLQTTFLILLHKFNASGYLRVDMPLAPAILVFYNIVVVTVLFNLMISIIIENLHACRDKFRKRIHKDDMSMVEFLKHYCDVVLFKISRKARNQSRVYLENITAFQYKLDILVARLDEIID
jgi:hypothetical protein